MGRKCDMPDRHISAAISLLKHTSLTHREIAAKIGISHSSVTRIQKKIYEETAFVRNRKGRCGAKRKTTERTGRKIVQTAIKYRRQPTRKIQTLLEADGIKICSRTIRRRLAEKGYKTYRAVEKPKLTGTMM